MGTVTLVPIGSADVLSERAVCREDTGVGVVGWLSGSCGNRVQRVAAMVVLPAYSSLACWPVAGVFTRAVEFHQGWWC